MIDCPGCRISFSPRHRICPRCKSYKAKLEDRIPYLADRAELALDRGVALADAESMLVEEGLSSLEASEIVIARARKVKWAERSYGLFRLFGGLVIILFASVLALLGLLAPPSHYGIHLVALALLIGAAGARPFILGVYSVLAGREQWIRRRDVRDNK